MPNSLSHTYYLERLAQTLSSLRGCKDKRLSEGREGYFFVTFFPSQPRG